MFDTTGHEEYESYPQDEMSAVEKYVLENMEEEECEKQEAMKQDEQMEEAKFMDGKDFYVYILKQYISTFPHVKTTGTWIFTKSTVPLKNRFTVENRKKLNRKT